MKLPAFFLVLCAFPVHAAELERVSPQSHVTLSASEVASAAETRTKYRDTAGGYHVEIIRARSIACSARNLGTAPVNAELCVVWIGNTAATTTHVIRDRSASRFILRADVYPVSLAAGASANQRASSGTVTAEDMSLNLIGVREVSGCRIEGWAATVRDAQSHELLAARGSEAWADEFVRSAGHLPNGTIERRVKTIGPANGGDLATLTGGTVIHIGGVSGVAGTVYRVRMFPESQPYEYTTVTGAAARVPSYVAIRQNRNATAPETPVNIPPKPAR